MLKSGTAIADITPPLSVGLLTSSVEGRWAPFESVRMPLMARVVVIESANEKIAIVSLDLIGLTDTSVGGWKNFKTAISGSIPPERIIINCTHTHNAPESVALTELYKSDEYIKWFHSVTDSIFTSIQTAVANLHECSLHYGEAELQYYSLQRRVPTTNGMVISDSLQPITAELFARKPVDRRIKALRFIGNSGDVIATIVHAVCHPVHEMCIPEISPDFPGELCGLLDQSGQQGMSLFLNGAAGDINPPTVSNGKVYAHAHGMAIAEKVINMEFAELPPARLRFSHREILLPGRKFEGMPSPENSLARISVANLGELSIVFLPGEPFVQTGLDIEHASRFKHTIIAGYAENSIGYIPPAAAFKEGGYETGPGKWSYLDTTAEKLIKRAAAEMLASFESIIP